MRSPWMIATALAGALTGPALAVQYYFGLDAPATLGGVTYTPSDIVRATGSGYLLEATFPPDVALAAMLRTPEGKWLLAPAATIVGSTPEDLTIEPRDLVLFDPLNENESLIALDGSAAGIPAYAAIDAVMYDRVTDQIAVSFDVPTQIAGVEYGPSDLVAVGAGFSLLWSGAAAGVPAYANLVGADQDAAGLLVLTFDVPVSLGGTFYFPGQLVWWAPGAGFGPYAGDPSWPPSSALADFGFRPAAGEVPGESAGSVPLRVATASGGQITLSWGASCAGTDTDYAVYEGTLGAPTTHVPVTCSTGGATTWTFIPGAGNRYYWVVPRNGVSEGSYGHASSGVARPPSSAACLPQEVLVVCG